MPLTWYRTRPKIRLNEHSLQSNRSEMNQPEMLLARMSSILVPHYSLFDDAMVDCCWSSVDGAKLRAGGLLFRLLVSFRALPVTSGVCVWKRKAEILLYVRFRRVVKDLLLSETLSTNCNHQKGTCCKACKICLEISRMTASVIIIVQYLTRQIRV